MEVKSMGSTHKLLSKLLALSSAEVGGIPGVAVECVDIGRNTMRKLVDWGKLPVLKVGRKTIIRRDTLEQFLTVNQGRNLRSESDVRKVE